MSILSRLFCFCLATTVLVCLDMPRVHAQQFRIDVQHYSAALDTSKTPASKAYWMRRILGHYVRNRYLDSAQVWVNTLQKLLRETPEDAILDTTLLEANHETG